MVREGFNGLSTTGHRQAAKEIRTTKTEQFKLFVNTINQELEELEQLILNAQERTGEESATKD